VVEGARLLSVCRGSTPTEGSNPSLSAREIANLRPAAAKVPGRVPGLWRAEQCELALQVAGQVASIVPLDHRDGGAAVFRERLQVPTARQRDRDQRVTGRVELSWTDAESAQRRVPGPLREIP
jgi:hypothetical protein